MTISSLLLTWVFRRSSPRYNRWGEDVPCRLSATLHVYGIILMGRDKSRMWNWYEEVRVRSDKRGASHAHCKPRCVNEEGQQSDWHSCVIQK
jgi:hypothetical protein